MDIANHVKLIVQLVEVITTLHAEVGANLIQMSCTHWNATKQQVACAYSAHTLVSIHNVKYKCKH